MALAPKARVTIYLPPKLALQARKSATAAGQSLSGWYALAAVAMLTNLFRAEQARRDTPEKMAAHRDERGNPATAKFIRAVVKAKGRGA
jgi:hypothetical protein